MIVGLGIHSILPRFFQTYYGDELDKLSKRRKEFIKNSNWANPTIDMELIMTTFNHVPVA